MADTPQQGPIGSETKKSLPIVVGDSVADGNPQTMRQMARSIQIALDDAAAPRQFNEIADKVASINSTSALVSTLTDLTDKISTWRNLKENQNPESQSTNLYKTMSNIEELLRQQLKLHQKDTDLLNKLTVLDTQQVAQTKRLEDVTKKQVSFWEKMSKYLEKYDKEAESEDRQFESKGQSAYSSYDRGAPGLFQQAKQSAASDLNYYLMPLKAFGKGLLTAGAVATAILASAGNLIEGYLAKERAGTNATISILGNVLSGTSIGATALQGYGAWKMGQLGARIGSIGGPIGSIAGGILGASLSVLGVVVARQMGPEKMTAIIQRLTTSVARTIDRIFGTAFVIDRKAIENEIVTLEKSVDEIKKHMRNNVEVLNQLAQERADMLKKLNDGLVDPKDALTFTARLQEIERLIKAEQKRTETLDEQMMDQIRRLTNARNDLLEVHKKERELTIKSTTDATGKMSESAKAFYNAMVARQEQELKNFDGLIKEVSKSVQDPGKREKFKEEVQKSLDDATKTWWDRFMENLYDVGNPDSPYWQKRRDDPDRPDRGRITSPRQRAPIPIPEDDPNNRNYQGAKPQQPKPSSSAPGLLNPTAFQTQDVPQQMQLISFASNHKIPPTTQRMMEVDKITAALNQIIEQKKASPTIIQAPTSNQNVAVSSQSTAIYAKTNPDLITDPMLRRSAFGYT